MGIFITLFGVILIFVCLLMILVIMMQRPKQEGLGAAFGGGLADHVLGAGTTGFLQKATVYFAVFYFILSAGLAVMVSKKQRGDNAVTIDLPDATPELSPGPPLDSTFPANLPGTLESDGSTPPAGGNDAEGNPENNTGAGDSETGDAEGAQPVVQPGEGGAVEPAETEVEPNVDAGDPPQPETSGETTPDGGTASPSTSDDETPQNGE